MADKPTLRFSRRRSERVVAGVCGGLADTLGVPATYVRAAFISLGTIWGLGALIYLALWLATFDNVEDKERVHIETSQAIGLGLVFAGSMVMLAIMGWWPNPAVVLTAGTLAFGTAFLTDSSKAGPLAALMDPSVDRPGRIRVFLGLGLLIGGLAIFTTSVGGVFEFGLVFLAVSLTGLGLVVAFGPWVRRLVQDLGEERSERVRQEERAEVAAHLHDSVLQTLALIQRTDDPGRMAMLARHQESELRDWLYGNVPLDGVDLVSTALKQTAARVEADFQLPIDVVVVGDYPVDDKTKPVIAAASEALVNAAKHSGAERVSLYLEVEEDQLTVFVTDQGKGFEPASVGSDRKGISESITSRMRRAGGHAEVVSEPGEGTEVVIRIEL